MSLDKFLILYKVPNYNIDKSYVDITINNKKILNLFKVM